MGVNTYISISNSDDRLSQAEWAEFIAEMRHLIESKWQGGQVLQIHGTWYSGPEQPWQNANWCVEILPPSWYVTSKARLQDLTSRAAIAANAYPELLERREEQCRLDMAERRDLLKEEVRALCARYRQDSFAWTTGEVELVETGWTEIQATQESRPPSSTPLPSFQATGLRFDPALEQAVREGWAPTIPSTRGAASGSAPQQPESTGGGDA